MAVFKKTIVVTIFSFLMNFSCFAMHREASDELDDLSAHSIPLTPIRVQFYGSLAENSESDGLLPSSSGNKLFHSNLIADSSNASARNPSGISLQNLEILKETFVFCAPYMLAKAMLASNTIWNSYLYGQIDETAIAAVTLIMSWQSIVTRPWLGGLQGTSIFVGQLHDDDLCASVSRGNVEKVAALLSVGYFILTIPLLLEVGNISSALMNLFHFMPNPEISGCIQDYFDGFIWGVIPTYLLYNDEQFSLGIQDTKVPLIYNTVQAFTTCILSYPLALGKWGSPKLGVKGMGYSMAAGVWISWIALRIHYVLDKQRYEKFQLYDFKSIKAKAIKKYLQYSIPLGVSTLVGPIYNFMYGSFILSFGKPVAGAYNASVAYFRSTNLIFSGYTTAVTALIANKDIRNSNNLDMLLGQGEDIRGSNNLRISIEQNDFLFIKKYYNASVLTTTGLSFMVALPVILFSDKFITFFGRTLPENTAQLAHTYIGFSITNSILTIHTLAHQSALLGLKDVMVPLFINISVSTCGLLFSIFGVHNDNPMLVVAGSIIGPGLATVAYGIRSWRIFAEVPSETGSTNPLNSTEESYFMKMWHKAKKITEGSFLEKTWESLKSLFISDNSFEEAFSI
jgi:Na+-driven multidrug efflux pump